MTHEPQIRPAPRWPHAIATLAFAGLAAATALTRSTAPVVLGRYSASLFVYQILNVVTLGLLLAPAQWERARWAGYALAVASTFLAPINEAVGQIPGITAILPAVRLVIAWSLIVGEFDRFRRGIMARRDPRRRLRAGRPVVARPRPLGLGRVDIGIRRGLRGLSRSLLSGTGQAGRHCARG